MNTNLKKFLYMDMEYKNRQSREEHEQAKVQEAAGCVPKESKSSLSGWSLW